MINRRLHLLILMFGCVLVLRAQAQAPTSVQIREDDERITTFEDRQRAMLTLQSTVDELRKSGQTIEAARTSNRVGRFQMRLHLGQDALDTFQKALKLLEETPDVETRIDSLNGVGAAYRDLSNCDLARTPLEQAISLSKQSNYVAGQAEALLILSDCQNFEDHPLALKSAQEALELWRSIRDKRGIAEAYAAIGSYQMTQNSLAESRQSFEAALSLWRELNASAQQAAALISLGFIEYRKGAWQDSLAFYTQAQQLLDEKAEPYKMGQIAAGLAEAFIESGLPEIGLAKYREASEHYRLAKNPRAMIAMGWGIGKALYMSGNYKEALFSLQTARSEAESIKESTIAAMCSDFLGRTYYAMNDSAAALSHFQSALDGYQKTKNPMEVARTEALMGRVYQGQGSFEKARNHYQTALATFRALSDHVNESATLHAFGTLELTQNHLNAAEDYLRQSIDVTEGMRRVSTSSDLTAAFSATVQERYESYIECLMRKHEAHPEQGFAVRAFETSELGRARALTELLQATQTDVALNIDPELAQAEKSIRQSLRVKEDSKVALLSKAYKKEELKAVDAELARLEGEYKQITEKIRVRYPSYEHVTRPTAGSLRQIQEQVIADDQTLLLEYALGSDQSYLWAVTRSEIFSFELPGRAQIEDAARSLRKLLTANQPVAGETLEQRQARVIDANVRIMDETASFSKLVLGPVYPLLGQKRLIIVPDGALQYIPFQALTVPASAKSASADASNATSQATAGNQANEQIPLIVDHEIVNEPSASALALVMSDTTQRKPAPNSIAVFANPVFESDDPRVNNIGSSPAQNSDISQNTAKPKTAVQEAFRDIGLGEGMQIPPLPASREEAEVIMSVVPWRSGLKAVGFDASRATISGTDLGQYRIVHFATHGFVDYEHPELSGLVLSLVDEQGRPQDGFLRMHDIYNLKLPVDLVVLSACNTALGKEVKGEGLIGLTRGFMYAGAGGVAASLWKVDDEATAELMKYFYEGLFKRGSTPAAALREAQIAMWSQKRWHSPYYWAAFVLQGQYNQKEMLNPRPSAWQIAALAALILTLPPIVFLFLRRRKILKYQT